ncbi:major facilitator superfamily-domain-containing protein [Penicillium waksmanii]|uniref:major facilitator superfamily-domain-containing protein n=1 Tax=Penicillium waksmanii TaxID=69791 RepID=UPI002548C0CA|nr:major facilitator superfamily-domain-containing protein [Penicillium waksmanii]KAJ5980625.1 major facilitator superfamily-domain-containing protein [Penicillium waksmanii]
MTSAKRGTDPSEATPLLQHESTTSESRQTTHYHSVTSHSTNVENNYSIDETQEQINALGLVRVTSAEGLDIEPDLERFSSRGSASVKRNNASAGNTDAIPEEEDDDGYAARFIDVSPARFWLIFVGVLIGYLIGFFDSTLMASSHPVITSYFNAANTASWLSTAFLLTSTAFLPLFGRISDAFGRKPVYLFSIVMFFLTTAWCGLAQSIGSFIAARALCGLGAGGVFSMGQIISSDLVRIEYRGVYQSYINLCYGTGSCLGLAFGGFLCDRIGWRGAFFIQLPFIFVYFITAASTIPADLGIKRTINSERMTVVQLIRSIDLTGAFILATAVTALIMGLNLGGNVFPWEHPLVISSLVAALLLGIVLIRYERGVPRAVLPIELLSKNPRASLIIGNFFGAVSVNTVMFNVPLYFQAVKLASPTDSGLRLVAASIAITASSVGTGFLITWSKRMKPTIILGGFCMLLGGCTAASLNMNTPYALAMICVSFSSLGQGFSFPSVMVSVLATSEQDDQAVATTTLGLARNLGAVMGVSISSWIFQNTLYYELERNVKGVEKDHIIALVRKSIRAISGIDPLHQHQVIGSYATALRATFLSAALWGALMLLLHSRLRLPRLGSKA